MKHYKSIIVAAVVVGLPVIAFHPAYAASSSSGLVHDSLVQGYNWLFGTSSPKTSSSGTARNDRAGTPSPAAIPNTGTGPSTAAKPDRPVYVALGDSVAAGLGLSTAATPSAFDAECGRSPQAYGTAVAKYTGLPYVNVACSGATAGDLYTRQGVSGPNIPAQLTAAYASGSPQLITMTAGANDAHWSSFIKGCYAYDCAAKTYTAAANAYLTALQAKLYVAFETINQKSAGQPPATYVTGYYNPTSPACTTLTAAITPDELTWIAAETNALNQTIQQVAAHYTYVHFVPVDFTGHDLCTEGTLWVQGLAAAAPLHPTAAGQRQIAASVIAAIRQSSEL